MLFDRLVKYKPSASLMSKYEQALGSQMLRQSYGPRLTEMWGFVILRRTQMVISLTALCILSKMMSV